MKRVLITGARGFIGRHCLPRLHERGYEVHATCTRSTYDAAGDGTRWHAVDLLDAAAARELIEAVKPTHLLHLAWRAVHGDLWNTPENLDWLHASLRLIRAFEQAGGQRVTVSGTCGEYDWSGGICHETRTPRTPTTFYGACKHALHGTAAGLGRITDLQVAWGRVFFVYGPGEHPGRLVASVIRSLLRGEAAECSHGRQVRDYLHVDDVADGLVTLLDAEKTGAFNLANGQATSLRDIIGEIGRYLGKPELIELGARPAQGFEPPVILGDPGKAEVELGWRARIGLEEGLAATIDWYRQDEGRYC